MDLPALVESYGYIAVFVGAFLEGETILALAGLAASRGYLDLAAVIGIALIAGFLGDQFFFFVGRVRGKSLVARFPAWRERAERFDAMLARWHTPLIVGVRFMYGFRILGPIMLGMGRVSAARFMLFNFIGAAIWAPVVVGLGFAFGAVLETVLHDLQLAEIAGVGLILALCVLVAWSHRRRARRHDRHAP